MRVMGQTVGQRLDGAFKRGDPALRAGQHIGPTGKTSGEFVSAVHLWPAQPSIIRGLAQGSNQGGFGSFGQRCRLHPKRACDVQQQFPADSAPVVFD